MSFSYKIIKDYENYLEGSVVEIGSQRGENSTVFLAGFCLERGLKFYSVDFEEKAHERAKEIEGVLAYQMTGEKFLAEVFPKSERICCAYLDNFDWTYPGFETHKRYMATAKTYEQYGLEMTNENSQASNLAQCVLIERLAAERCLMLIDDTWKTEKGYDGKGGTAVPYLLGKGFDLLLGREQDYQCVGGAGYRVWVHSGDITLGRNIPCTEK